MLLHLYRLIGIYFNVMKGVWIAGDDRNLVQIFRVAL
jgi:hypothetical protein